ncbi:MAG: type II toxin-antitoxin system RelE/ParE family toxin [Trueperaceae bacterium]
MIDDAARDLDELYTHSHLHHADGKADLLLDRLEEAFTALSDMPEQGAHPPELLALGIREYREIAFDPYRVLYRLVGNDVYVLLIVDGRRAMQSLLQRRLLEA